jgi:micrococcal nuclease
MAKRRHRSRSSDVHPISPHRPSRRVIVTAVVTLIIAVASCVDHTIQSRRDGRRVDPVAVDKKSGTVSHVVDGDTIDVVMKPGDPPVRVRLLGIDAPEGEGPAASFGIAARNYAKARCEGKQVTLRLDELQRDHDKYGRLLAYVYLSNNELFNESLVRDGMAFSHRRLKCDLSRQLDSAENEARKASRGLWKSITVAQMPEWRREWLAERGLK